MTRLRYPAALAKAIDDAIGMDEDVVVINNYFGGLSPDDQRFFDDVEQRYPDRYLRPPCSELGVMGAGIGAATTGLRPLVDVGTASFVFQGWAQLVNEAANVACVSGGQSRAPVVFHMLGGLRGSGGAQHSHRPQAMLWNTPGLQIALPASPSDAYGLMLWALRESRDPTVFINHTGLYDLEEEVGSEPVPFGRARTVRPGQDVTVVATSVMVPRAVAAAERLAADHLVDVEVIDPRTIAPLDETLLDSVRRTGRLVVADECHRTAGVGSELVARIAEQAFASLTAPPRRVAVPDIPVPLSPPLEDAITPREGAIVDAVLSTLSTTMG